MSTPPAQADSPGVALAAAPLMVSTPDAARLLGVSKSHFNQLNSSGRIGPRPHKLGAAVRWSVRELEAWVDAGLPGRERWLERSAGRTPDGLRLAGDYGTRGIG